VDDRHPHVFAGVVDVGIEEGIRHPRTIASSGMPRAATYAPASSQLPIWPVTITAPFPFAINNLDHFPAFDGLDEFLQAVLPERVEQRRLNKRAAEVLV